MEMTASAGVQAEFDGKAPKYESNRLASWYRAQNRLVAEEIESLSGTVVDIGCGTGWLLRRLALEHPSACGLGIDLSGRMIEVARAKAGNAGLQSLQFVVGNWESEQTQRSVLERVPHGADLVSAVSSFHYFQRPLEALRAIRRILAPDGRLLLLDRALDGSAATKVWDLLHRRFIRDSARFYTTTELVHMLQEAGFSEVVVRTRIQRIFWHGKLNTSLVLISSKV